MKNSRKIFFAKTSIVLLFIFIFSNKYLYGITVATPDNLTTTVLTQDSLTQTVNTQNPTVQVVAEQQPQVQVVLVQCPYVGNPKIEGPRTLTNPEIALFNAIGSNNIASISTLVVNQCANVNVIGNPAPSLSRSAGSANNWAPLHHAVQYNTTTDVAKKLFELRAFVNITDDLSRTPLHWSAMYNKPLFVNFLIDKGANVNAKDKNGSTPLHLATSLQLGSAAHTLLARGASIATTNNSGQVPFHVKILLAKYGTDTRGITGKDVTSILQQTINNIKYFDLQNKRRRLSNSNIQTTYGSWQNTLFGDPVPGKYKYLTVWYRLIYGAPTSTNLSREITINPSTMNPNAVIGERNDFAVTLP
ncbi:MAG: hypothetical protein US22_C0020G0003 [candidate division TM6 bacterium GW2011_GWF2_36_6]|nr:MAG: hypothetical protein US22_C0020G0003 [candidate division TM6 bacterium GW2011_GWF2_36_6]